MAPQPQHVSELVTNTMLHARTDLRVSVSKADHRLRMAVRDGSSNVAPRQIDTLTARGRGLLIVEGQPRLARAWGVLPTGDGGKVIGAVTDLRTPP